MSVDGLYKVLIIVLIRLELFVVSLIQAVEYEQQKKVRFCFIKLLVEFIDFGILCCFFNIKIEQF